MDFLDINSAISFENKICYSVPRIWFVRRDDFKFVMDADRDKNCTSTRPSFGALSVCSDYPINKPPYLHPLMYICCFLVIDMCFFNQFRDITATPYSIENSNSHPPPPMQTAPPHGAQVSSSKSAPPALGSSELDKQNDDIHDCSSSAEVSFYFLSTVFFLNMIAKFMKLNLVFLYI